MTNFTQLPPSFLHDVIIFAVFYGIHPLVIIIILQVTTSKRKYCKMNDIVQKEGGGRVKLILCNSLKMCKTGGVKSSCYDCLGMP